MCLQQRYTVRMRVFQRNTLILAELMCVVLAAPFLLFPGVKPTLTLAALCLLGLVWFVQVLCGWWITPVTPLNGPLLVLGIGIVVGTAVSSYPDLTLSKATSLLLGLALLRILVLMPATGRELRLAITGYIILSLALVGFGLLNVDWGFKVTFLEPILRRLPRALISLPETPAEGVSANQIGGLVATVLPLTVVAVIDTLRRRRIPMALLAALGTATASILLLLSQSRSAWVGAVAGVYAIFILIGITAERRQRQVTIGFTLLLVLLSIGGLLFVMTPERAGALLEGHQGLETGIAGSLTLSARVEIWSRALYAIQDFVFTGCGLGTFREVAWILYPLFSIPYGQELAHAHNIFLQVALDTGVPGLIGYIAVLGAATAMAWRMARDRRPYWLPALGIVGGLVALHVYGMTDALAPGSKPAIVFWYMLGLLAALFRSDQDPAEINSMELTA
jgi:putative inorganic carbon (hco3(-)) transporter